MIPPSNIAPPVCEAQVRQFAAAAARPRHQVVDGAHRYSVIDVFVQCTGAYDRVFNFYGSRYSTSIVAASMDGTANGLQFAQASGSGWMPSAGSTGNAWDPSRTSGGSSGASEALMQRMPQLKIVCCFGAGYEGVDLAYTRERGIALTQQRVAIARAIVKRPELLLCDEPTGDLDRKSGDEILDLLQTLNREHGKTIIMVTHDAHAAEAAKSLVHLEKGELLHTEQRPARGMANGNG